ncbi:hypothetical protein ACSLVQ_29295, partial [Klebsiella pneumoniae]|uniref:hypothetical protein n=1 Tax=Klebsiella pneumoniae TaxID=573 RepID=UPI003EE13C22
GLWLYTSTGRPYPKAAPTRLHVPTSLTAGQTYAFSGVQLSGLTQGAAYGDDYQSATNYPLVRIVNQATGHVVYARTSGFSSYAIA